MKEDVIRKALKEADAVITDYFWPDDDRPRDAAVTLARLIELLDPQITRPLKAAQSPEQPPDDCND